MLLPFALLLASAAPPIPAPCSAPVPTVAPASPAPPARGGQGEARRELRNWLRALRVNAPKAAVDSKREKRLEGYLSELQAAAAGDPKIESELRLTCLDLASLGRDQPDLPKVDEGGWPLPGAHAHAVAHRLGKRHLELLLERDPDGGQAWLALDVLATPKEPLARRIGALDQLRADQSAIGLQVSLQLLERGGGRIQPWVRRALVGWPDPDVDTWFATQWTGSSGKDSVAFRYLELHLRNRPPPLPPAAQAELLPPLESLFASSDWRDASRALALTAYLDALTAVPLLLDALEHWTEVEADEPGTGARRLQNDLVDALRGRSQRSLGRKHEVWRRWWSAASQGLEAGDLLADEGAPRSSAEFFGLRAVSDQVWFVLDRSTSMTGRIGDSRDSRYKRAIEQLLQYLETSGPETRFGVTLFSSNTVTWRDRATWATERNLKDLEDWLDDHPPDGETHLEPAIRDVLRVRKGRPYDPRFQEVDTLVVLCDGDTDRGPDWVEGFMENVNSAAQVVFHCILLGTEGDGTLEALARESGGQLVRVR